MLYLKGIFFITLSSFLAFFWRAKEFSINFDFIDFNIFWTSFLSNFFAGFLVALLFAWVFYLYSDILKKPKLKMKVKQNSQFLQDYIDASQIYSSNDFECKFKLSISNNGGKALKGGEGYWHIFFDGPCEIKIEGDDVQQESPNHYRFLIKYPIFANNFLDINSNFVIKFKEEDFNKVKVYYFFSTQYGYFPNSTHLDKVTGHIKFNTMSEIKIKLNKI